MDDCPLTLRIAAAERYADAVEEPTHFMQHWDGDIVLDDPEDTRFEIGKFSVIYADVFGALADNISIFDLFDTEQNTMDIYNAVFDGEEYSELVEKSVKGIVSTSLNIFILDRLAIYPEYRGKARGLIVLRALIQIFGLGAGLIIMKPFALQGEPLPHDESSRKLRERLALDAFPGSQSAATGRLRRYYKRLGFKQLGKTAYMVRSGDYALPTIEKLKRFKIGQS